MKKIFTILCAVVIFAALIPTMAAGGTLPVIKVEFPVIINGRIVDNAVREYPFILCNSVTYFPMTYDDCAFLGLYNGWSAEEGNVISKAEASGIYKEFLDPTFSSEKKGETATVATTPITVLGEKLNNGAEAYPILNYKNILYFPLTWDWSQKFGWNISFSEDKILEVTTEGFEDTGYFYTYNTSGSEVKITKNKISDTSADSLLYGSYASESSPNYVWRNKNDGGFVTLFRLVPENESESMISVREDMVDSFTANGWHRIEDAEKCVYEFIKTHSKDELRTATATLKYGLLSDVFFPICDKIESSYVSLYSGYNESCTVPESEVYAYTAAGWMKADNYAIDVVNYCESRKSYGQAMTALEKNMGILYGRIPGYTYPDFSEFDYYLGEELYDGVRKRYAEYMGSGATVRLATIGKDNAFIIVDCVIPEGKYLKSLDLSYDLVDSLGNVISSVNEKEAMAILSFEHEPKMVKSGTYHLNDIDSPYAVGITNIKITNLVYDDYYNIPMGIG